MAAKEKTIHRKQLTGKVVGLSDDKTFRVEVETKRPHPLYGKIIKSHKKYLVDNAGLEVNIGDSVVIEECRPLSKRKTFKLVNIEK